uniref:Uncharacterized protein n=1 Tax=Knipowitschia caucasica TaxID=637954 RepID=A0AAV2J9Y2_KNICA
MKSSPHRNLLSPPPDPLTRPRQILSLTLCRSTYSISSPNLAHPSPDPQQHHDPSMQPVSTHVDLHSLDRSDKHPPNRIFLPPRLSISPESDAPPQSITPRSINRLLISRGDPNRPLSPPDFSQSTAPHPLHLLPPKTKAPPPISFCPQNGEPMSIKPFSTARDPLSNSPPSANSSFERVPQKGPAGSPFRQLSEITPLLSPSLSTPPPHHQITHQNQFSPSARIIRRPSSLPQSAARHFSSYPHPLRTPGHPFSISPPPRMTSPLRSPPQCISEVLRTAIPLL